LAWVQRSDGLFTPKNKWWLVEGMISVTDVAVVYQPIGATNIANSYVNLNSPGTNNATPVVAPTFATATGWTFTGTQHLTSNVAGTGDRTIIVRCNFADGTYRSITGYDTGARNFYVERRTAGFGGDRWDWGYNAATANNQDNAPPPNDHIVAIARNKQYRNAALNQTSGVLDTWSEGEITIANTIVSAARFSGEISAYAIYNRELDATEIGLITENMLALTSSDDPDPDALTANINYIVQKPSTKRLNNTSHELLAAANTGLFHTINGGRWWDKITLPDPSNDEFGDIPAATIDELNFHYADYDPINENTVFLLGQKTSTNRQWIYKSSDNLATWSSRGIITV